MELAKKALTLTYVTAGTVKTHAAHIYRKAGVGGKQELIDLYEREAR